MQNNFYLLVIENDDFYDTKSFDSYLFETEDDAIEYMRDLMESYKIRLSDYYDCSIDELMQDYIETTRDSGTYINWFIEYSCNIRFYIQEKPLLKFK